mmetsp:Transcript_51921/g.126618  ORF Transcript_51921/g.126618 Transcript_51921/m.126618 type:complete len:206 (-) Transcript_51921:210-827(-)
MVAWRWLRSLRRSGTLLSPTSPSWPSDPLRPRSCSRSSRSFPPNSSREPSGLAQSWGRRPSTCLLSALSASLPCQTTTRARSTTFKSSPSPPSTPLSPTRGSSSLCRSPVRMSWTSLSQSSRCSSCRGSPSGCGVRIVTGSGIGRSSLRLRRATPRTTGRRARCSSRMARQTARPQRQARRATRWTARREIQSSASTKPPQTPTR